MIDPATLSTLASSAVTMIGPLLKETLNKGAEELGKSSAAALVDKLKQKLTHVGTKEALEDLGAQPEDTAAQGALVMQLRKALASDPELATFLQAWIEDATPVAANSQTADVRGNNNKVTQIIGSGNSV